MSTSKFPVTTLTHNQNDYIDGIRSSKKWDTSSSQALTYSFPATGDYYPGQPNIAGNSITAGGTGYTNQSLTFPTFKQIPLTPVAPATSVGTNMGNDHITVTSNAITSIDNDTSGDGEWYKGDQGTITTSDASNNGLGSGSGFRYTFGEVNAGNNINGTGNWIVSSAAQQTLVALHLATIAQICNVTFSPITETRNNHGVIRWSRFLGARPTRPFTTLPGAASPSLIAGGDTWSPSDTLAGTGGYFDDPTTRGSYCYIEHLHEILHGMGFKHPHDLQVDGVMPKMGGSHNGAGPTDVLDKDAVENTIMSYRSFIGSGTGSLSIANGSYPTSMMAYDVATLIINYGYSLTPRVVTTISWNASTGEEQLDGVGQGATGGNNIFQTWHGKIDTMDVSNFSTGVTVDLTPGSWTTLSSAMKADLGSGHTPPGNVCTPLDTTPAYQIRKVSLGTGTNTVTGNSRDNEFVCSTGTDTIDGTSTGTNTVTFTVARSSLGITNNSGTWTVAGQGGNKTLTNIQYIQCSDGLYPLSLSTGKNRSTGLFRYHF